MLVVLQTLIRLTEYSRPLRYATIYTMFPVFSLVLDQDVKPEMAILYPELYKDLTKVWPSAHGQQARVF